MDLELSPREKELAQRAREFCDQVLIPLEEVTSEHGELPLERRAALQPRRCATGLSPASTMPREHGGSPASPCSSRSSHRGAARPGHQRSLVLRLGARPSVLKFGTPAQQQEYLLPGSCARGSGAAASPSTRKPNAGGSDPRRVETTAPAGEWNLAPGRREVVRHLLQCLGFHHRPCPCRRGCRSADPVPGGQAGGPEARRGADPSALAQIHA